MNIEISPQVHHFIEAQIGQGLYHSPTEVLEALIKTRANNLPPAKKQLTQEEKMQLIEECRALAVNHPFNDGLNGSTDHDKILYSNY